MVALFSQGAADDGKVRSAKEDKTPKLQKKPKARTNQKKLRGKSSRIVP